MGKEALSKNQINAKKMREEATRYFLAINNGSRAITRSGQEVPILPKGEYLEYQNKK